MAIADSRRGGPTMCAGPELRRFFAGGLAALEQCAEAIDALNVFPVPDADTGTNLLITLRHAVEASHQSDSDAAGAVARAIADAALHRARGNSGAIFAQLCAGFAHALEGTSAIDPCAWADAWRAGATAAWHSVACPVEGTLLTVARATAAAAAAAVHAGNGFGTMWASMADAADVSVADSPRLLPVLRRAEVVDAGALGLAIFLRGGLHAFTGAPLPDPSQLGRPSAATRGVVEEAGFSRFCTQFSLSAVDLDRTHVVAVLSRLGESIDVVTPPSTDAESGRLHVHVHTDRPDEMIAAANALGVVSDVSVDDMERQRARYAAQLDAAVEIALVPVVSGAGMRRLFESLLGVAAVVDRDHSHEISETIAATLDRLLGQPLIVLPNDPELVGVVASAAAVRGGSAAVVPTLSMPAGVAAALAFNPVESLERNLGAMAAAANAAETIEVRWERAGEDLAAVAEASASALAAARAGSVTMITAYYGADVTRQQADTVVSRLRRRFPDAEIEAIDGGQLDCPLWIAFDRHAEDANRH